MQNVTLIGELAILCNLIMTGQESHPLEQEYIKSWKSQAIFRSKWLANIKSAPNFVVKKTSK